jgi:uncharacterized protein (DUF433 family)
VDDIVARFGEGDSIPDLARDYDVEAAMVEEALRAVEGRREREDIAPATALPRVVPRSIDQC